ncbi:type IV pilus modification protein PilV [Shewanella sediminis HAW-EB3]|uniref:Type IV pilus modification protein PilV n=1 Tax=Shewanella sediminis (strain HAW-EB3) TaxID=425104 RepID=A8FSI6_SHESH|nr:type IV pilus modification protein PilV [Shewanella sediminis]ABV35809.1 type IV pilus modification protein PilV [Shewanella sediminis HAW-EB3]
MLSEERGFSLIEVMVALVILVVGLVGVFNLHIVAKRGSFESFQQTQASYYASDIINRMKLNRGQLANYAGNYTGVPTIPSKACTGAAICSPSQTVTWDLYEWRASFVGQAEKVGTTNVGGLDTPTGCVTINGNNVTVVMAWKGIRSISDAGEAGSCGSSSDRRRLFTLQTVII